MTMRRPMVRIGAKNQQLPQGDVLAGMPVYVSAFRRGGALVKLVLTTTMTLPILTRSGASLQVQVIPNG